MAAPASGSASKGTRGLIVFLGLGLAGLLLGPASCVISGEIQNHGRDLLLQERGKKLNGVVTQARGTGSGLLVGAGWSEVKTPGPSGGTYRIGTTLPVGTGVDILYDAQEGRSDRAEDVRARLDAWPLSRGNILISCYLGAPVLILGTIFLWKRRAAATSPPPRARRG